MLISKLAAIHSGESFSQSGPFFVAGWTSKLPGGGKPYYMARQCVFIEVEVDTETGQMDITKLIHPYDVGQSINPDVNEQLYGGAYHGLEKKERHHEHR